MSRRDPEAKDFPWWLVIVAVTGAGLYVHFLTDVGYGQVLRVLVRGIWVTVYVTLISFGLAAVLGLLLAVGQLSRHLVLRQACRLYVEVMRGVPILVLLLYVAFVGAPAAVAGWNWVTAWFGIEPIRNRDVPLIARAIAALALAYGAFLSEVFRAGILSVDEGQIEAAQSLGLTGWQRFRLIVMPQALRTILPPLGNDFVAMVKDSSLVSVVGVGDLAQLGKTWAAGNYRYLETYNVMAVIYMTMTIGLSLMLRRLERRLRARTERV